VQIEDLLLREIHASRRGSSGEKVLASQGTQSAMAGKANPIELLKEFQTIIVDK